MGPVKFSYLGCFGFKNLQLSVLFVIFLSFFTIFGTDFCLAASPQDPTSLSSPVGSGTSPATHIGSNTSGYSSQRRSYYRNSMPSGSVSGSNYLNNGVNPNPYSNYSASTSLSRTYSTTASLPYLGYPGPGKVKPYRPPTSYGGSPLRGRLFGNYYYSESVDVRSDRYIYSGTGKLPPLATTHKPFNNLELYSRNGTSNKESSKLSDYTALKGKADEENQLLNSEVYIDSGISTKANIVIPSYHYRDINQSDSSDEVVMEVISPDCAFIVKPDKNAKPNEVKSSPDRFNLRQTESKSVNEIKHENDFYDENTVKSYYGQPTDLNQNGFEYSGSNSDRPLDSHKNMHEFKSFENKAGDVEEVDPVDKQMQEFRESPIYITTQRARQAIAEFEKFDQKAHEKYKSYITLADMKLKNGRYESAIDYYELASIWSDGKGRADVGKAYSAFAMGQYVKSSNILIWAIDKEGDEVIGKMALGDLIGDVKLLEMRMDGLRKLHEEDEYFKTAFLMAFIAYQNSDSESALKYIEESSTVMGKTRAWKTLNSRILNMGELPKIKKQK